MFGGGLSRGATTLLQSLALDPPFTALPLEGVRAGNISHPYELVGDKLGMTESRTGEAGVAVLLLQGSEDRLASAERLRNANPGHTDLVVFPGADHEWFGPARPEVMKRVLGWFEGRSRS